MRKSKEEAPIAVGKAYDFVLWLLPKAVNFLRAHKFTVGERLTAKGLYLMSVDSYGFSAERLDEIGRTDGQRSRLTSASIFAKESE